MIKPSRWRMTASCAGLLLTLVLAVWLRGHTVGPSVRDGFGIDLWPMTGRLSEPLDCDEAVYAYIGRRLNEGAVMYRDLTENKPPLGYWLYSAATAIGGANEWTIRLMPIPYVLLTIVLAWAIAWRLGGPGSAVIASGTVAIVHVDPHLFGNGANMEHFLNLFATAGLALGVWALARKERSAILWASAGTAVALASLVKQVAGLHLLVLAIAALAASAPKVRNLAALGAGFGLPWLVALGILTIQGASAEAFDDIIRYGGALAADTPTPPNSPPAWIRWLTGNADPTPQAKPWDSGGLPWPFGDTKYYDWWGTGTWPFWIATVPAALAMAFGPGPPGRKLLAGWIASSWLQVALPGLYWQHYYLLPVPASAIAVALLTGDAIQAARRSRAWLTVALALGAALAADAWLLARDYLGVAPMELTAKYKGGGQWIMLRELGREIKRRTRDWDSPKMLMWGWQSPLYIYAELDGVTRHIFADPLLKAYAPEGRHPLIAPRLERIVADVEREKPEIIFCGDPPFPALKRILDRDYLPSRSAGIRGPNGEGLWVEKSLRDRYDGLER